MKSNISIILGSNSSIELLREIFLEIVRSAMKNSAVLIIDTSNILGDVDKGRLTVKVATFCTLQNDFDVTDLEYENHAKVCDLLNYSSFFILDVFHIATEYTRQLKAAKKSPETIVKCLGDLNDLLNEVKNHFILVQRTIPNETSKMRIAMDATSFSMVPMGEENRVIVSMCSTMYSKLRAASEKVYLMVSANHFVRLSTDFKDFIGEEQ